MQTNPSSSPPPLQSEALARVVWKLTPTILRDVCQRLERQPETRATITWAAALAVALVDVQSCRPLRGGDLPPAPKPLPARDPQGWDQAARRSTDRLKEVAALIANSLDAPNPQSLDAWTPAFLGTRGDRHEHAAMALASEITGYLHVDLAMAELPGYGYGAVVVDTLLCVAAVLYTAMMRHELTPPEERHIACYQVSMWRAYARVYGPSKKGEYCTCQ